MLDLVYGKRGYVIKIMARVKLLVFPKSIKEITQEITIWDILETEGLPLLNLTLIEFFVQLMAGSGWRIRFRARLIQIKLLLHLESRPEDPLSFMDSYLDAWTLAEAKAARRGYRNAHYVPLLFLALSNLPLIVLRILIIKFRTDARRSGHQLGKFAVMGCRIFSFWLSCFINIKLTHAVTVSFDLNGGPLLKQIAGRHITPVAYLEKIKREHLRSLEVLRGPDDWILMLRSFDLKYPYELADGLYQTTGLKVVMLADPTLKEWRRLKVQTSEPILWADAEIAEDPHVQAITSLENSLPSGVYLIFPPQDWWTKAAKQLISKAAAIMIIDGRITRGLHQELRLIEQVDAWDKCIRLPFRLPAKRFFKNSIHRKLATVAEFRNPEVVRNILASRFDKDNRPK